MRRSGWNYGNRGRRLDLVGTLGRDRRRGVVGGRARGGLSPALVCAPARGLYRGADRRAGGFWRRYDDAAGDVGVPGGTPGGVRAAPGGPGERGPRRRGGA